MGDGSRRTQEPSGGPILTRIVVLRATDLSPDPRAERLAEFLADAGYAVTLIGWDRSASLPPKEVSGNLQIQRFAIPASYGAGMKTLIPLVRWQVALAQWLIRHRREYDVILAIDLDTGLVANAISKRFRKRLIYDIADFYGDSRTVPGKLMSAVVRAELNVVQQADAVLLADHCRVPQLRGMEPKRLEFFYNTPSPLGFTLHKNGPGFRAVYVGILQPHRMLREVVQIFGERPEWLLELGGFGPEDNALRAQAANATNIRFLGVVKPYSAALETMSAGSALFAIYDPAVPNHRYSSANKLFEAMMLGKPIIVARNTGMDETVTKHALGIVVDYGDMDQLHDAFQTLASRSSEEQAAFAERAQATYRDHYSSETMRARLLSVVSKVVGSGAPLQSGHNEAAPL